MKILITGGAGFIGSHLAEMLLKEGHEITVIDNLSTGRLSNLKTFINNITFVEADISQNGEWTDYFKNIDIIFHFAALADIVPSIQNPDLYYKANVTGTLNILETMKKFRIKKIFYSASSSCYGIPKNYPTSETHKIDLQYPYAFTKYIGECLIIHWSKIYNLEYISTRFFNVYGTRSRTSGTYGAMFGVFMAQKLNSKPLTIVGNGEQKRDFTYVTDICEGLYKLMLSGIKNEIFNLGSSIPISINSIANIIGGQKKYIPKRPGEPEITHADITKLQKYIDWKPKISINEGINLLLDNIDYWKEAPIWDPDSIAIETKLWFKHLGDKE